MPKGVLWSCTVLSFWGKKITEGKVTCCCLLKILLRQEFYVSTEH